MMTQSRQGGSVAVCLRSASRDTIHESMQVTIVAHTRVPVAGVIRSCMAPVKPKFKARSAGVLGPGFLLLQSAKPPPRERSVALPPLRTSLDPSGPAAEAGRDQQASSAAFPLRRGGRGVVFTPHRRKLLTEVSLGGLTKRKGTRVPRLCVIVMRAQTDSPAHYSATENGLQEQHATHCTCCGRSHPCWPGIRGPPTPLDISWCSPEKQPKAYLMPKHQQSGP